MVQNAWIIPLLPLAAYVWQTFWGRRMGERSSWVGVIAMGVAAFLSLWTLLQVIGGQHGAGSWTWLDMAGLKVKMGFQVGPLEAVMLTMVTWVSWMVEIYSMGYMHGDRRYSRFFAIVNLFIFSMLTVVLADNILLLFFGWELMGLASYLLIGHWFEDAENAKAATKAFMVTRLGDIGFLLGIFVLFQHTGSLGFHDMEVAFAAGKVGPAVATLAALLIFAGAVGKSAQVPLQMWLPDAMAGPTPISALIHAATMVAAGVFLVARMYSLFLLSPSALFVVALIGAVTAFLAATIATLQVDIKKVLAYSTISQLGYMMLGLGVLGYAAGVFHLLSHAFFKALLFLGSGSVIHAMSGEQNMHKMGGLFKKLRWTGVTFIIGSAALAGLPPFSGFFSKDEVILAAYRSGQTAFFWLAVAAAGLTAYYMTRAVWLTFFGQPRDHHLHEHAHESPLTMVGPLVFLAIPATLFGWLASGSLPSFIERAGAREFAGSGFVQGVTMATAAAGIGLGLVLYAWAPAATRVRLIVLLRPLYVLLKQKWYFDHLAVGVAYAALALAAVVGAFDRYVVDGLVNGLAWLTGLLGQGARRLSTGNAQAYMMTLLAAAALGMIFLQVLGG